ncbi:hypothetical protein SUGI_0102080 [Cryptomeria japonica]|nr:hypothetical protein SUGI_0102080 [Cryptomeria japonica]
MCSNPGRQYRVEAWIESRKDAPKQILKGRQSANMASYGWRPHDCVSPCVCICFRLNEFSLQIPNDLWKHHSEICKQSVRMGEMQDQCVVILPNMVDDIGLLCLARLPHSCRAKARCVCRSWRRALANPSSLRRSFNLQSAPEHCLFIALFDTDCDPSYLRATEHNTRWLFIHPSSLQTTEPLPNPLSQISTDRLNLRSVAATSANLFLPDIPDNKIEGFQSYNAEHRRRSAVPFAAPDYKHVRLYACAALGDLVFFSGGQNDVTGTAQSSGCMWVSVGFVGGELQRNPCLSYKVIAVGEELWVVEHAMGRDIRIHAGMPPKNCRDGRTVLNFREVKLPELEGFDHVLTCTVLAL